MRPNLDRPVVTAMVLGLAASACSLPTDAPEQGGPSVSGSDVVLGFKEACYDPGDPSCLPGPPPDDPAPSAPGYYIGPDYTMSFCRQSNDLDVDGFDDNCEMRVASRFSPLLASWPADDVSRETYWVATYRDALPGPGGGQEGVEVMYLISYHLDLGDDTFGGSHSGDSEFVVLRIKYDESTHHWMLVNAFYAAHHGAGLAESDFEGSYSWFQYPDKNRGYPRVWVAARKHGSYRSKSACNGGGVAGADDCSFNFDDERLEILESRNLGTGVNQFVNCVASTKPFSYPGTECFWNAGYEFCGWDLDRTNCSTAYRTFLNEFGFYSPFV